MVFKNNLRIILGSLSEKLKSIESLQYVRPSFLVLSLKIIVKGVTSSENPWNIFISFLCLASS